MAVIISNFEPVYVDDNWSNDNSCPVPCEECGCRDECYWVHGDDTNELEFLDDIFNIRF